MASPNVAAWLARLVRMGKLTPAAALSLAANPIANRLVPLPVDTGLRSRESGSPFVQAYLGNWPGQGAIRLSRSAAIRANYRERLQHQFESQVRSLAASVSANRITVAQWQQRMSDAISNHTIRQAALGRGSTMSKGQVMTALIPKVHSDLVYLQRFADELALAAATGRPMSAKQIAARSTRYAGTGRAEWFRQHELAEARPGYVIRYRAKDDSVTCAPCRQADGFYLRGEGPLPGAICLGRNHCRCRRDLVYDPAMYQRLTGDIARPRTA